MPEPASDCTLIALAVVVRDISPDYARQCPLYRHNYSQFGIRSFFKSMRPGWGMWLYTAHRSTMSSINSVWLEMGTIPLPIIQY